MVTWPMTSRDPKGQTRDNTLREQHLENSWRCHLATIDNYCCEAVRSAIHPIDSLAFVLCSLANEKINNSMNNFVAFSQKRVNPYFAVSKRNPFSFCTVDC